MEQVTLITISPDELSKIITSAVKEALDNYRPANLQSQSEFPNHSVNLETLCKMYNWKKPTVYRWIHDSIIPNSRIGKTLYFNIADIEKWIATGRRKTHAEIEQEANDYILKKRFKR
jgi:excisionase family DNA binding protein